MLTEKLKFDDITDLKVYLWGPESEKDVKGVIQIAHGMAEHMGRYDEFATYLANNGYVVVGCDLYAHGKTALNADEVGVVTRYDFMMSIIKSIKIVYDKMVERFEDYPHYLFAHSMSSMVAQRYLELYPLDFDKAILSGTDAPSIKYSFAKLLSGMFMNKNHISYSKFIDGLGAGGFNKKFKNEKKKYAWLSRDLKVSDLYEADPYCGKMFPVDYYYSLSKMLINASKHENLLKINHHLKIQIMSGQNDPVGNFGKGPKKLADKYLKYGFSTNLILYPEARHECHNELADVKNKFYQDVLDFYNK